jgi:cation diffusion facilitator CzcD-associated flavoprotein CzcO
MTPGSQCCSGGATVLSPERLAMACAHSTPRVIVIGAGFSGLCLGYHLERSGIRDFTILEKADRVGGTWRENTYPGAACDVPSITYCFSFAQKTDWSRKWAPQAEILAYMEQCADDFGLRPHLRLGTEVASARFDEGRGVWTVRTTTGEELEAEVLVSGVGQLHRPYVPDIPGLADFEGAAFHSARWNHAVDLTGKRVAVIGNAASAIQLIPQVAKTAGRVHVFQRSANWMMRRNDRAYTEAEKERFARHPWLVRLLRGLTWAAFEAQFPVFAGRELLARRYRSVARQYLEETITDPALRAKLTPDYPIGAKRILISDDYYEALTRENVELVTDRIDRVTPGGIVTADGTERPVDVIVLATGFRTTEFLAPMEIVGRGGRRLTDAWRDGAEAYLGLAVAGFPNFFMTYGPNTNLGHNSIIFMIECQTAYIMDAIRQMRERGVRWIDLSPEVQRTYNEHVQRILAGRVWANVDHSWYKNAAGKITNNWSGTTIEYWWRTRHCDLSKYRLATGDAAETGEVVTAAQTAAAAGS